MAAQSPSRTVSLTIPAKPDYVVLARLALSGVCRLSPLALEEVWDLKLAITESAAYFMGGERRRSSREVGEEAPALSFSFDLGDNTLHIEVSGEERPTLSADERELSLALIAATVDDYHYADGHMTLTKKLDYSSE